MTSREALEKMCEYGDLYSNAECRKVIEQDLEFLELLMNNAFFFNKENGTFITNAGNNNELLYQRYRIGYYKNDK